MPVDPASQLNQIIPGEIKNDAFYLIIQQISRVEKLTHVLEIGSSSGEGSTEAFVTGLRRNPSKPTLFCMEVSKTRFKALADRYAGEGFVKCYNASSVPAERFPSEPTVTQFYNAHLAGRFHPLPEVLRWLRQDIEYVRESGVPQNGIELIKRENGIDFFDLVLIDGSEFTGSPELDEVYGAAYILLDDVNTYKNAETLKRLGADANYVLIDYQPRVRNGFAVFKKKTVRPIAFSTIRPLVERVEGFMMPGQEEFLFNKVASLPDDAVIMEIGSYKGRSTAAMGHACIGTNRRIYCIDTWDGNDKDFPERKFFDVWKENIRKNGLGNIVFPLQGMSHDMLAKWEKLAGGRGVDFAFIDGSHEYSDVLKDFQTVWPLVKEGGWIAFHDVHFTWPGPLRVWHQTAKRSLAEHEYQYSLACGQKVAGAMLAEPPANDPAISPLRRELAPRDSLPIHFFTIVLNGEPFIRHHIEQMKHLNCDWHWHIMEGVAELKHDTAWSVAHGGRIPESLHKDGRSIDGTSEYLDQIAREYPDNVTVYRKQRGSSWDGKLEMISHPPCTIDRDCLLWEIDADEIWTAEQLTRGRQLFLDNPTKTAAMYWNWYFVGPNLVISTRNCYANNPQMEWIRTWRYRPNMRWAAHEPPLLAEPAPNGQWRSVVQVNPFLHDETEAAGLVFQHYAYATEAQVRFKEDYYGYRGAVNRWRALQAAGEYPAALKHYFPWVADDTQVDRAEFYVSKKLIDLPGARTPYYASLPADAPRPRVLIDGVFWQMYSTGIARVWESLLKAWVKDGFAKNILVLDRVGTAPKIEGVYYRVIGAYDYANTEADRAMLQRVCDEEKADVFTSTYYSTPARTPQLFMLHDMIPEVFKWPLNDPMWREKHRGIREASAFVSVSEATKRDFLKFFPQIAEEKVRVTHLAAAEAFSPRAQEELEAFRKRFGVRRPYFLLVGARGGYKNTILTFRALSKYARRAEFDIVCSSGFPLEKEFEGIVPADNLKVIRTSDDELAAAYTGAVALLHPSVYEGFGLPVLEALACGCPVITTKNGSLAEVADEAALFVPADGVDAMTVALDEIQKADVRERLRAVGLAHAARFSWEKTARMVREALEDVAARASA